MQIKLFEDRYRDDLIFLVLSAKDALGRVPRLNEDLYTWIPEGTIRLAS